MMVRARDDGRRCPTTSRLLGKRIKVGVLCGARDGEEKGVAKKDKRVNVEQRASVEPWFDGWVGG